MFFTWHDRIAHSTDAKLVQMHSIDNLTNEEEGNTIQYVDGVAMAIN